MKTHIRGLAALPVLVAAFDSGDVGGTLRVLVTATNSAGAAATPRNLPCPTCERPNVLTPADRRRGYQCDVCADADKGPLVVTGFLLYAAILWSLAAALAVLAAVVQ